MRRVLPIALLLLASIVGVARGPAVAEEPEAPSLLDPLPFDHAAHADSFERGGVSCSTCHPVGLRLHDDEKGYHAPAVETLHPPLESCHGCHRGEFRGAPRAAEGECLLCHADREELIPVTHAIGWLYEHGGEARGRPAACRDCHETTTCTECHEARGPLERSPHPPGWRTGHGIEARVDPYGCSTCHDGEKCVSCHTTGATPW